MTETFSLPDNQGLIRRATRADLSEIVRLIADDQLGQTREVWQEPLPEGYIHAFESISKDPNQFLAVLEKTGKVVGTFQLTFIPGISHQGSTRAQVEAVRIEASLRGRGLGQAMIQWAIAYSRNKGCHMMQLTSNKSRKEAHRFYERLGFEISHEGMKLKL